MKPETENTYQQLVNRVIDYISAHLHENIKLDNLAMQMGVSSFHFHRLMRSYLGEPLANYITRQRLERSAAYLQTTSYTLTELAEKIGYETPQSFSKAFKKYFGITPLTYRKTLGSEFKITRRENTFVPVKLHPVIKEADELRLVYIRVVGKYGEPDLYEKTWAKLQCFLVKNKQLDKDTRWIGLSFDDPHVTLNSQCRFYACATCKNALLPEGEFGQITVKGGRFAVYEEKENSSDLQNLYDNIYHDFPFKLRDAMPFEEYYTDPVNGQIVTKVYIPIY